MTVNLVILPRLLLLPYWRVGEEWIPALLDHLLYVSLSSFSNTTVVAPQKSSHSEWRGCYTTQREELIWKHRIISENSLFNVSPSLWDGMGDFKILLEIIAKTPLRTAPEVPHRNSGPNPPHFNKSGAISSWLISLCHYQSHKKWDNPQSPRNSENATGVWGAYRGALKIPLEAVCRNPTTISDIDHPCSKTH